MNQSDGKICMAKLARVKHQQAQDFAHLGELMAEEARLLDELAEGETVDIRTGHHRPKYRQPLPPQNVTDEERAAATQMLRDNEFKRRSAR